MRVFPTPPALPTVVAWADASRQAAFDHWLACIAPRHGIDTGSLAPASADASFRRYLRVNTAQGALIVMDAPPPQEDVRPFIRMAQLVSAAGLHGPRVLEADVDRGFLLLSDLGSKLYLHALQNAAVEEADRLMRDALNALVRWQCEVPASALPPFDEALLARELALFPEWCVKREFDQHWTARQQTQWDTVCRLLMDNALAQPQVAVHADWMPRNLMVCDAMPNNNPGILDFQDAVRGPISYDLASLLRDAFLSWDESLEIDWAVRWWQQARGAGLPVVDDFGEFWRQLEWMGLQRHLKVMGIFCRLKHRDGKAHYASDLPRFFNYANKVAMRYAPLRPLLSLLEPLAGIRGEASFTV
jgi:N-acetylmuramate 1-kinase